jgi:hypothetical protein
VFCADDTILASNVPVGCSSLRLGSPAISVTLFSSNAPSYGYYFSNLSLSLSLLANERSIQLPAPDATLRAVQHVTKC